METLLRIAATGDYIEITPLKYLYKNAVDSWDSNWLETQIKVKAGAFAGTFPADFQTFDFTSLRDNLQNLYGELNYQFEFKPLEGQLVIEASVDGLGHIVFSCIAMDRAGPGNSLSFQLHLDQTYLPTIISQLNQIVNEFPVVE